MRPTQGIELAGHAPQTAAGCRIFRKPAEFRRDDEDAFQDVFAERYSQPVITFRQGDIEPTRALDHAPSIDFAFVVDWAVEQVQAAFMPSPALLHDLPMRDCALGAGMQRDLRRLLFSRHDQRPR